MDTPSLHEGSSRARGRGGRPRKGDRELLNSRVPREHKALYESLATSQGLFLGDYVALVLARAHDLDEPEYLTRDADQPSLLSDGELLKKTG